MTNFINPIDLLIILFIIIISLLGIKNGLIIELKKIINLFLSLFLSYNIVEMTHHIWLLSLVDFLDSN